MHDLCCWLRPHLACLIRPGVATAAVGSRVEPTIWAPLLSAVSGCDPDVASTACVQLSEICVSNSEDRWRLGAVGAVAATLGAIRQEFGLAAPSASLRVLATRKHASHAVGLLCADSAVNSRRANAHYAVSTLCALIGSEEQIYWDASWSECSEQVRSAHLAASVEVCKALARVCAHDAQNREEAVLTGAISHVVALMRHTAGTAAQVAACEALHSLCARESSAHGRFGPEAAKKRIDDIETECAVEAVVSLLNEHARAPKWADADAVQHAVQHAMAALGSIVMCEPLAMPRLRRNAKAAGAKKALAAIYKRHWADLWPVAQLAWRVLKTQLRGPGLFSRGGLSVRF